MILDAVGPVPSGQVKLGIRPEHFRFADQGLEGRVDQIEPMGRETLHVLETPLGVVRVLDSSTDVPHAIGTEVHIGFDENNPLLFDGETGKLLEDARTRLPNGG